MSDAVPPAIELFEAIHTARAQRRLAPDPVPEALITRVLDAAIRAPSAGNAQNWHFVVVRDVELRRRVGALYRKASDIAEAVYRARSRPAHLTEAQWQRMLTAGAHLGNHMGDAPVLLIPCRTSATCRRGTRWTLPGAITMTPSATISTASAVPASTRRCRTSYWPAGRSGWAP